MSTGDKDIGAARSGPPIITPRSSSLRAATTGKEDRITNSQGSDDIVNNSGSDGENAFVREKLKKTSIAGMRSERQPEESERTHKPAAADNFAGNASAADASANHVFPRDAPADNPPAHDASVDDASADDASAEEDSDEASVSAETPEDGSMMSVSNDKSDESDSSSTSSRKRSREPDDDGDNDDDVVESDEGSITSRRRRKRSRELSDEPEPGEVARDTSVEMHFAHEEGTANEATPVTETLKNQAYIPSTPPPPPAKMDEDVHIPDSSYTSPSRKLDGRKRVREEDIDAADVEVKTKKPLRGDVDKDEKGNDSMSGETVMMEAAAATVGHKDLPEETITTAEKAISENAATGGDKDATEKKSKAVVDAEPSREAKTKAKDADSVPADAPRTLSPEPTKIPPGSGFSNMSAKSPFAMASAGATPLFGAASSASLFAKSKFGAMSGSASSPFASLGGASAPNIFAPSGTGKPPSFTSGGPSPWRIGGKTTTGGFGGFSLKAPTSAFGELAKSGGDIISGAPKLSGPIGGPTKPVRPFGAPEAAENGSDGEGTDSDSSGEDEEKPKKDSGKAIKPELSQEVEVSTGEEGWEQVCSFRAKLFHFVNKAWKERGVGNLRLLQSEFSFSDVEEGDDLDEFKKPRYRLVMRTDAVHKVILNTPVMDTLVSTYGDSGKPPVGNTFKMVGQDDGKEAVFIIKLRNASDARSLYTNIMDCLVGPAETARRLAAAAPPAKSR